MKSEQQWEDSKVELATLKKRREELQTELKAVNDRIKILGVSLNTKDREQNKSVEQSIAYQMFGKQFKELNAKERREYFNARYNAYKEKNGLA